MVDLVQEMTDVDTLTESEDGANVLIEALVRIYNKHDIYLFSCI